MIQAPKIQFYKKNQSSWKRNYILKLWDHRRDAYLNSVLPKQILSVYSTINIYPKSLRRQRHQLPADRVLPPTLWLSWAAVDAAAAACCSSSCSQQRPSTPNGVQRKGQSLLSGVSGKSSREGSKGPRRLFSPRWLSPPMLLRLIPITATGTIHDKCNRKPKAGAGAGSAGAEFLVKRKWWEAGRDDDAGVTLDSDACCHFSVLLPPLAPFVVAVTVEGSRSSALRKGFDRQL